MQVAPYVGAWIETMHVYTELPTRRVAPYVGAWIETCNAQADTRQGSVAPYVGAWIETLAVRYGEFAKLSHPTWVRGLKHRQSSQQMCLKQSHPTWVRGLKLETKCK